MDDDINRVGSTHVCEFDGDSFDIKTLQEVDERDQIIYIEQATSVNHGMSMLIYYELNKISDHSTDLTFRVLSADRQPIQGPMAEQIYAQNEYGLSLLKHYAEKLQVA